MNGSTAVLRGRHVDAAVWLGGAVITGLIAVAVAGPIVVPTDPHRQDLMARFVPPLGFGGTLAHPLGTDGLGRDLLARLIAGARVSLALAVAATAAAAGVGVLLGATAGWLGGSTERLVDWLTDVQAALPFVAVAIAATAALGNGVGTVLTTLIVTGWVAYARVVRLRARALRAAPWIEAAAALGLTAPALLWRHGAPHLIGVVAVLVTQQAAAMILYEASLSYLGLGIGGDAITWGSMAAEGREALLVAPWVSLIPGLAVASVVLGLNRLGDAVAGR